MNYNFFNFEPAIYDSFSCYFTPFLFDNYLGAILSETIIQICVDQIFIR